MINGWQRVRAHQQEDPDREGLLKEKNKNKKGGKSKAGAPVRYGGSEGFVDPM